MNNLHMLNQQGGCISADEYTPRHQVHTGWDKFDPRCYKQGWPLSQNNYASIYHTDHEREIQQLVALNQIKTWQLTFGNVQMPGETMAYFKVVYADPKQYTETWFYFSSMKVKRRRKNITRNFENYLSDGFLRILKKDRQLLIEFQ